MKRRNLLLIATIILIVILLISKCNCTSDGSPSVQFIQPPIKEADVPYCGYNIDASKGDTIIYPSGSILLFPPDAFVDKDGSIIKGNVSIKYREFKTPIDFFLSGIPMGYDSAGVHYTFESAGMCDIQAFQNNQPVFVNKKSKPQIFMSSDNTDKTQNLYYLDTVSKQWINRGKSEIMVPGKKAMSVINPQEQFASIALPVKPYQVSGEMPIIKVKIDEASFKELLVYDNLKFQLDKNENHFNPSDANEEWNDFELQKGNVKGLYQIKFSNKNKSVVYLARPVLEAKDYAKAMLVYDRQMAAYKKNIETRVTAIKANRDAHIKDSLNDLQIDKENAKTAALNKIIEAKNAELAALGKKIEEENKNTIAENKERKVQAIAAQKWYDEKNKKDFEQVEKNIKNADLNDLTYRNFQIDGFGIWNCDKPFAGHTFNIVIPKFIDEKGKYIFLYSSQLFIRNFNGVYQFDDFGVGISINKDNMIVGIVDGRFAYITYEEVKKLNITSETKQLTFPLHVVDDKNNNYAFIKKLFLE